MLAWNLGVGQEPPDDAHFFAVPNYILFMILTMSGVVAINRKVRDDRRRTLWLATLLIGCGSIVASWWWEVPIGLLDHSLSRIAFLESLTTLAISLSLLGMTVRWSRKQM
jgi:hypothetical protein